MSKKTYQIQELKDTYKRCGCSLSKNPQYVLVGELYTKEYGLMMGILAAANNEFHARVIKKEIQKYRGKCNIEITEYHPTKKATFRIDIYKAILRKTKENLLKEKNLCQLKRI
jgi:hypothetical protein